MSGVFLNCSSNAILFQHIDVPVVPKQKDPPLIVGECHEGATALLASRKYIKICQKFNVIGCSAGSGNYLEDIKQLVLTG